LIKITLPPAFSQLETKAKPMRGLPEPPGPLIKVEEGQGNPWGSSLLNQFWLNLILLIRFSLKNKNKCF